MYKEEDIKRLLNKAENAGLTIPEGLINSDIASVIKNCNGIGAEFQSLRSRKILTKLMYFAEASALIHDWQYSQSNGKQKQQKDADNLFLINCYAEINSTYKWYNPLRWLAKAIATIVHTILFKFGFIAYKIAYVDKTPYNR